MKTIHEQNMEALEKMIAQVREMVRRRKQEEDDRRAKGEALVRNAQELRTKG